MGASIRWAGRGMLAALVVAGLAGLGVAGPAAASSRTAPGRGPVSPARAAAGAARADAVPAGVAGQVAGRPDVPGFPYGFVSPAGAFLGAISCPAASFCVAVGGYSDPLSLLGRQLHTGGHGHSLAEQWNGRTWRVMPGVRGAGLTAVSCPSARFCMAAASPIERWGSRRWTAVRTPPGLSLTSISCPSASFCMTVGLNNIGRSTRCMTGAVWRGTAWRAMTIPFSDCGQYGDEGLTAVSCASASACFAAGYQGIESDEGEVFAGFTFWWNGKKWRSIDVPTPSGGANPAAGFLCPTRSACLVFGSDDTDGLFALSWDGTTWRPLSTPPQDLGLLSCTSADHCVGLTSGRKTVTWDGTTWTEQGPAPQHGFPGAISCWRPTACMAVGSYGRIPLPDLLPGIHGGAQLTLAERWNGSAWKVLRTPSPGDEQEGLSGVSCRSAASCVAVGAFVNGSDVQAALAERWNGRAWKVLAAPDPGPGENVLTAVSCPVTRQCIAVGYFDAAGRLQALAEQWNGSTWTTLTVPHNGVLTGVSCPAANDCVAVGSYRSSQGAQPQPLSVTWDGSTWTVQASPSPAGSHAKYEAVTCPARTRCIAVGEAYLGGGLRPLTALWNGTAWTMLTTPAPAGSNTLTSVSCSRPSNCMAVGQNFRLHRPVSHALAESWDGTRWTVRPAARLKIKIGVHLNAVSCPAPARCQAAGGYLAPSGNGFVLAEAWNGTTWHRLVPITDPSTAFTDLYAISCPAARHCIAVGGTENQRTLAYQWNGTRWQRLPTPTP